MTVTTHGTPALRSAERLTSALGAADIGTWEWDLASGQLTWSPALGRLHGLADDIRGGSVADLLAHVHPADRETVAAAFARSVAERQPHDLEYRVTGADGSVRFLQARGRVCADERGDPAFVVAVCLDVTAHRAREHSWAELDESRRHAEAELAEQMRLARLSRDVGLALTQVSALPEMLQRCTQIVVDHLGAAFARIWTLNAEEQVLELRASAGMYTHLNGPHGRVPVGKFKIGLIAEERAPHLTNAVVGDPRVGDQAWARREGMVAFAGYPLIVGDALVGVLAMFARQPLSPADFDALATVANAIGVGIARARADAEIRDREQHYRFLADTAPTQVWTAGPDGTLDFANAVTHDFFGLDIGALGPDAQQRLIHPDDLAAVNTEWARALAAGEPLEMECRMRRHDGEYRWHIVRATPFRDVQGTVVKWFGTNTDIHDAKMTRLMLAQRAEELAMLAAALQRSNQDLDQFAYVASHDLKAPLRGIANLSQWLEEDLGDSISETGRNHLALLRARVHRMEALIDGILEYSRAGRVTAPSEEVPVRRVLADVLDLLQVPSRIEVELPPDLPVLQTERLPLQQVFMNLIGNAVKHGGGGPDARISVSWSTEADGVAFRVRDNGPGIAPAFHGRVWGIFQTLQPRDKVEGTGIGLALVKKIVEGRGGRVWVDSAEGAGATFGFTWPETARERA